ncbi:integrative conjugative element protein, RAQPRD family [Testudinibacter sp. P80/BLE/0925]|uniref:integrative conjugative element protein, RAQPRD family n=1 Tax=Testudinibacter sp. TW-1 TaxID=3417757 RepID=UPI003D363A5D
MRKFIPYFILFMLTPFAHANEQMELDQAIKQLNAAEQSLLRAQANANANISTRFYFDYSKARQDIATVRAGIHRYLNTNRAQPRPPTAIKELSGDYEKSRKGY